MQVGRSFLRDSPYKGCTYLVLHSITFGWCTGLIWRGFRQPLTQDDLWHLDPKYTSKDVTAKFQARYLEKLLKEWSLFKF